MSEPDPFRLEEPEPEPARPKPTPRANGEATAETSSRASASPATLGERRAPAREGEVDERTVAERKGVALPPVRGVLPPPPGWPIDAWVFPLRGRGPVLVVSVAAAWALLDALSTTPLLFAGLFLKIPFVAFLFRWFTLEAGMTAAGRDEPLGFERVLDMDAAAMRAFLGILACAAGAVLPGLVATWLGSPGLGAVLWILGSTWFSVALLGAAVGDPGLKLPWRAGEWLAKRPLPFVAGAIGPWALAGCEVASFAVASWSFVAAFALLLALRGVAFYLWLLSARSIGVAGRAWTPPWEEGPVEP